MAPSRQSSLMQLSPCSPQSDLQHSSLKMVGTQPMLLQLRRNNLQKLRRERLWLPRMTACTSSTALSSPMRSLRLPIPTRSPLNAVLDRRKEGSQKLSTFSFPSKGLTAPDCLTGMSRWL